MGQLCGPGRYRGANPQTPRLECPAGALLTAVGRRMRAPPRPRGRRGVSPAPFPHQMIPTPPSRRLQRGSARPAVAPGPGDRDRGGSGAVPALCQAPAPRSDRRSPSRESKGPLRPSGHPSVRLSVSPGQEQRPRPRPCRQELGERPPHTTGTLGTWSSPRLGKRTPERGPDPAAHRGLWLGLPPGTACALLRTHGC